MKSRAISIIRIILFLIGFAIIYKAADYCISDDTSSETRITYHDFYGSDSVDMVLVGSSHAARGINATLLSEKTGKNIFNLASAGQDMVEGYYVVKEAVEQKKVKEVIYVASVSRLVLTRPNPVAVFIITDYMRSLWNKAGILYTSATPSNYLHGISRLRRNLDPLDLPSRSDIKELLQKKSEDAYKNYEGGVRYQGNGQWTYKTVVFKDGKLAVNLDSNSIDDFSMKAVKDRQLEYLEKMIAYCKEKGVKLTFMIPAYSEFYFMYFKEYSNYTKLVKDIAAKNGIDVIDLNLVKKEYLDVPMSCFYNLDHPNYDGSCLISDFLADYLIDPSGDYFYDDLRDKYPALPGVRAVEYHRSYITQEGAYTLEKDAVGDITSVRFDISAAGYEKIPCRAVLFKAAEESKDGSGQNDAASAEAAEITGETIDEYTTRFEIPYSDYNGTFIVKLLDSETGEQLYEAETKFNME